MINRRDGFVCVLESEELMIVVENESCHSLMKNSVLGCEFSSAGMCGDSLAFTALEMILIYCDDVDCLFWR